MSEASDAGAGAGAGDAPEDAAARGSKAAPTSEAVAIATSRFLLKMIPPRCFIGDPGDAERDSAPAAERRAGPEYEST